MTIQNPLGSLGYSPTVLPNMTGAVESLQRTEIERELQEIKQNKQWERDDALRNQRLALEFAAPSTFDSLRQSQIEAFVNRRNEYEKKAASFFGSGIPSTSPEYTKGLVELQREKQALINETMKEKAFSDAYSDLQGKFPAQYKSLETQEQKDQFNKQIADFVLKMKDPKQKVEVYDMIQAFTPPEAPVAYELSKVSKELVPLVDKAIMRDANGRTQIDEAAALKTIGANLAPQSYLFEKGVREGLWKSPEEMNMQVLDRIRTSIGINPVGWRPREARVGEEVGGTIGSATYANIEGDKPGFETENAYIITSWPKSKTIPVSTEGGIGQFTPKISFPNGMVQGTLKATREVPSKEMDYDTAENMASESEGSRLEITEYKNGVPTKAKVISKAVIEKTYEIPWSKNSEVLGRIDPSMKQYFESQGVGSKQEAKGGKIPMERKGEPQRFTPAQEDAISKLMKLNPTMTREQIIERIKNK